MKELLIKTLSDIGFGANVFLQGSMSPDEPYPERFATFYTVDSPAVAHFDNRLRGTAWRYQVANYATDPAVVKADAVRIHAALASVGFIPQGRGRDLMSDESTHTGWVNDYIYIEMEA